MVRRAIECGLRLPDTILAVLCGTLLAASLPPPGWWPLGLLGLAGLVHLAAGKSWRRRAVLGFAAGVGQFGVTLSWAADFNVFGSVLLIALESAFLALAMGVALVRPGPWAALTVPAAFVLAESARARWPFGGLPLGGMALGQAAGPFAPVAALGGPLAVVAAVAAVGAALVTMRNSRRRALAVLAAVAVAVLVARLPFTHAEGTLSVATVQGGGPRGVSRADSDPREVFDRHLEASSAVPPRTDLLVWPEDVVDTAASFTRSAEAAELAALARRLNSTVVAGIVEGTGPRQFRNAAVAFRPDGVVVDRYDKVHRVPFGEYVPARWLFRRFADLSAVPRDAVPGRGAGVLATPAGRFGVVISFEVFFADRARAAANAGGAVLLVPTNASSYRGRMVPAQELAAARLRAWETGRSVVQAAPTGYSAIISSTGDVLDRSDLGTRAVLTGRVSLRSGQTPYARLGDGPVLISSGAILLLAAAGLRSRRPASTVDARVAAGSCPTPSSTSITAKATPGTRESSFVTTRDVGDAV
jgi:apolipoprotein N-acyltransferase